MKDKCEFRITGKVKDNYDRQGKNANIAYYEVNVMKPMKDSNGNFTEQAITIPVKTFINQYNEKLVDKLVKGALVEIEGSFKPEIKKDTEELVGSVTLWGNDIRFFYVPNTNVEENRSDWDRELEKKPVEPQVIVQPTLSSSKGPESFNDDIPF